jgi:hypothetical protein
MRSRADSITSAAAAVFSFPIRAKSNYRCIPPEHNGMFVAAMEDVLAAYGNIALFAE